MKKLIVIVFIILLSGPVWGESSYQLRPQEQRQGQQGQTIYEPQFNPYTGRYETAPKGQERQQSQQWEPQFNPYTGRYETAPKGSEPTWNAWKNKWEMRPPGYTPVWNPWEGKWE